MSIRPSRTHPHTPLPHHHVHPDGSLSWESDHTTYIATATRSGSFLLYRELPMALAIRHDTRYLELGLYPSLLDCLLLTRLCADELSGKEESDPEQDTSC